VLRAASRFMHGRNAFYVALLLLPPLLWLGTVYLGSLFALLAQSFYAIDEFTAKVVPELTLRTYRQLFTQAANVDIVLRTVAMAVAVTIACGIVAFPVANYMARHAGPKMKAFFYVGVMLPMWTSYLVKVYAWRLILAKQGIVAWASSRRVPLRCSSARSPRRWWAARRCRRPTSHVHRVRLHVAAVHDPAARSRAGARAGLAAGRPPQTSVRAPARRFATWCCRSRCRDSPRARCSRSR